METFGLLTWLRAAIDDHCGWLRLEAIYTVDAVCFKLVKLLNECVEHVSDGVEISKVEETLRDTRRDMLYKELGIVPKPDTSPIQRVAQLTSFLNKLSNSVYNARQSRINHLGKKVKAEGMRLRRSMLNRRNCATSGFGSEAELEGRFVTLEARGAAYCPSTKFGKCDCDQSEVKVADEKLMSSFEADLPKKLGKTHTLTIDGDPPEQPTPEQLKGLTKAQRRRAQFRYEADLKTWGEAKSEVENKTLFQHSKLLTGELIGQFVWGQHVPALDSLAWLDDVCRKGGQSNEEVALYRDCQIARNVTRIGKAIECAMEFTQKDAVMQNLEILRIVEQ